MKTMLALLAALAALPAFAQDSEPTTTTPDYSRESLLRFAAEIPEPPKKERNVRFYIGAVEFAAIGQRWRFAYPVMPFSGTQLRTTQELPDPFSLTGTVIATPRRAWFTQRKIDAEMRRIEKTERAKIKVKTK
jgi:hypothetical protein